MTTKLEQAARQIIVDWDSGIHLHEAITVLREALAEQAEQEPVGVFANVNALTPEKGARWEQMIDSAYDGVEYIHLYAAPVEPVKQEPVAWMDLHKELGKLRWMGGDEGWDNAINAVRDRLIELATPHPVRTKDLTDAEIYELAKSSEGKSRQWLVWAVIDKIREKNK